MDLVPGMPPVAGLDVPAHALVCGASSGIGLAMVTRLVGNREVGSVCAVSRSATRSPALLELHRAAGKRLLLVDADLTDEAAIAQLADTLEARGVPLHLVAHVAGLLHDGEVKPEKSIAQVNLHALQRVFAINAFAPILLARALMPLLARGQPVVFASLSARVGSIGDNRAGGWYAYRASKAAQNQLMKTFSVELARRNRHACCLLLHPGTVDTPLSAPFHARVAEGKLFSAQRAAAQLLAIIAAATPADSGRFVAWDGSDVPW